MHEITIPRLVIAATHSGAGKTTIATALMAALARRGLRVQPFKVGPDFIDPSFHRAAAGRISRNLDGWMLTRAANLEIFARASKDADVAVIEGVMGLFDGHDGATDSGSTAEMAKWLAAPVVLAVDASAIARSAAAIVRGFEDFDANLRVGGVLFNRVAGEAHYEFLREAVAKNCRAAPLGFLPPNDAIHIPERHLGLTMDAEWLTPQRAGDLAAWIERTVDLDRLMALAREAPPLGMETPPKEKSKLARRPRIGIARDAAFCFYYHDNLDLLSDAGCDLIEFSPISDRELPRDLHGLYLGGGYPELYAARLAANRAMIESIQCFARSGAPVYAECGGLMYLAEAIIDLEGTAHAMTGIFPARARMQARLAALGYIEIEQMSSEGWLRAGERARGHEFRYSTIDEMPPEIPRVYRIGARGEGYRSGNVLGTYVHLHFASCPGFARRFADACGEQIP